MHRASPGIASASVENGQAPLSIETIRHSRSRTMGHSAARYCCTRESPTTAIRLAGSVEPGEAHT